MKSAPKAPSPVAAVIADYPEAAQEKIEQLRDLVFRVAARTEGVGPLTETLKWGEPSFLTEASGSGTTVRVAWKEKTPDKIGVYVNCQTTLLDTFRGLFPRPRGFELEGNRAVLLPIDQPLPTDELGLCIEAAFTYHQVRKSR
ncbi:MAG: DUF1801 domain-containing protein [Acidobacteriota bacterium]